MFFSLAQQSKSPAHRQVGYNHLRITNRKATSRKETPAAWPEFGHPTKLERGVLTVAVKDRQGNTTRIERTISVGAAK